MRRFISQKPYKNRCVALTVRSQRQCANEAYMDGLCMIHWKIYEKEGRNV